MDLGDTEMSIYGLLLTLSLCRSCSDIIQKTSNVSDYQRQVLFFPESQGIGLVAR